MNINIFPSSIRCVKYEIFIKIAANMINPMKCYARNRTARRRETATHNYVKARWCDKCAVLHCICVVAIEIPYRSNLHYLTDVEVVNLITTPLAKSAPG